MWLTILRQPALSSSAHMIYNRTQDIRMTESNLHWLAFGWRNMSVVDFYSISLICVSFSSYLYKGKHSLWSSWIHPLLKLAKVLLSRCQMVEDELSLGGLLLDSMTGLLCGDHFLLISHCFTVFYSVWQQQNDLGVQICWFFCAIWWTMAAAAAAAVQSLCLYSSPLPIFYFYFEGLMGWGFAVGKLQVKHREQVSGSCRANIDWQTIIHTCLCTCWQLHSWSACLWTEGGNTQRKSTWEHDDKHTMSS